MKKSLLVIFFITLFIILAVQLDGESSSQSIQYSVASFELPKKIRDFILNFANDKSGYKKQKNLTPTPIIESNIVWSADHETGNLSQWQAFSNQQTSQDSGFCRRPLDGVTTELAHSGQYSMKMTILSLYQSPFNKSTHSSCRQFRYPEARSGQPLYYSAWFYLPEKYQVQTNHFAMLGQFKARNESGSINDPTWSYQIQNRSNGQMYIAMTWDGKMDGPRSVDGPYTGRKRYSQNVADIPVKKWFHIEAYLDQSNDYTGRITVWQDGVQIYDFQNVKTKYPNTYHTWSVTSYGYKINPTWFTVYVDDSAISKGRLGSNF